MGSHEGLWLKKCNEKQKSIYHDRNYSFALSSERKHAVFSVYI